MGNQNLQFWSTSHQQSSGLRDRRFHMNVRNPSGLGASASGSSTILPERIEIHAWTIQQWVFDFQVSNLHLEFLTNGITYYDYIHVANTSAIIEVADFSVQNSNTLSPPPSGSGEAPLIMEAGETVGFKIFDTVNRLNNDDRWTFRMSLWGIRFPT